LTGRIDPVGDHDGVGVTSLLQRRHRRRPPDAETLAVSRECGHQRPIVDGKLGFGQEPVPDTLREQRFHVTCGRSHRHRMPLGGKPFPGGDQIRSVGAVDGDHQRLPSGDHLGRETVQKARVPHVQ
jgi:hypothetical protein